MPHLVGASSLASAILRRTMSQGNVEIAHRLYEAFNRHDLTAFLRGIDDDVEFLPILVALDGGFRGREGVRQWWESMFGAVPDYQVEVDEVRDLGAARTFSALRSHGHGSSSSVPVEQKHWQVIDWRDGKIVRLESFRSQAEALEAVGLSE